MKKKTSLVLAALAGGSLLLTPLQGQGLHLKGQLWGSFTYGDDPAPEHTRREATLGYIPTFSLARQLGPLSVVDLEAAYYWGRVTDGPFETSGTGSVDTEKWYRLWGRIATEKLELRLGLQKIAFGPARVLRPLMWFDPGEVALTYHYQQRTSLDFGGKSLLLFDEAENRLALDTRLDWIIGLWSEVVLAQATEEFMDGVKNDLLQVMVGGDYTFPWGDGVYVTVEHLWSRMDYYELPPPWS